MFGSRRKDNDPFGQLWEEQQRAAAAGSSEYDSSGFLKRVVTAPSAENREYVSPFRGSTSTMQKNMQRRRKIERYPTISASSPYSTAHPGQMGYRTMEGDTKRAKDIPFPMYLSNNEKRQQKLLDDLRAKEKHLRYLQSSQKILDYTKQQDDEGTSSDEEETTSEEGTSAEETTSEEGTSVDEEEEEIGVEDALAKAADSLSLDESRQTPVLESAEEEVTSEEGTSSEEEGTVTTSEEGTSVEGTPEPPMDPELAPMVPLPGPTPTKEPNSPNTKQNLFTLWKHKSNTSSTNKSTNAASNPVATPENPEIIVKTVEYGFVSKAVHDKVMYEEKMTKKWIENYKMEQDQKYKKTETDFNNKIAQLNTEIDAIRDQMTRLEHKTRGEIDKNDGLLTKKLLNVTAIHNNQKTKIYKETDLIKQQKLQEKEAILQKQKEIKNEITDLNDVKAKIQQEFDDWDNSLNSLSDKLGNKILQIKEINLKQNTIQAQIDSLNDQKLQLAQDTELYKKQHASNTEMITNYQNKTYLPQVNDIDDKISTCLNKLTLIKKEQIDNRNQLAHLTKKLEEERKTHEAQLELENEKRQLKEQKLLETQRKEMEKEIAAIKAKHQEELRKIEGYQKSLVSDDVGEEIDGEDALPQLAQSVLLSQNRGTPPKLLNIPQKQVTSVVKEEDDNNTQSRESSLFEYETEEEIISVP